jgi:predicted alpha/beta hydrolase
MKGHVSFEEREDYNAALAAGRQTGSECSFTLRIEIDDIDAFVADERHAARATGHVECPQLAPGVLPLDEGSTWNMFVDTEDERHKRMLYRLFFRTPDGAPVTLSGFKNVADDPNYDVWTDTSTLLVKLLRGHVTAEAETDARATAPEVVAAGILRITHVRFARMLTGMRGTGGTPWRRARSVAKFQKLFLGELAEVYLPRSVGGAHADFPDATPGAEALHGYPEGEWHDLEGRPGLRRRILRVPVGDGFATTLHHIRGASDPTRGPALLIHGTSVRANIFYGAPARHTFVDELVDRGFDVWLSNWRGSIDFSPHVYNYDEAAIFDHPAAVQRVCAETGADEIAVLAHCAGASGFMMSFLAGLVPQAKRIVFSGTGLHPMVSRRARFKQRTVLPISALSTPWVSAQWGLRPPSALAQGIARYARLRRRECDDPVCSVANYLYGVGPEVLWRHENLDEATHRWLGREIGFAPFAVLKQVARGVRAGKLVAMDHRPELPADFAAVTPPDDTRLTFVVGAANRLYDPEGQRRSFEHFDAQRKGVHAHHEFPGYAHLDVFFGRNAQHDTYPALVAGLTAS